MASVLSLPTQGPFKRSFSDNHSLTSLKDDAIGTLRAITSRNLSACSLFTIAAIGSGEWPAGRENTPPLLTSPSLLDLSHDSPDRGVDTRNTGPAGQSHRTTYRVEPSVARCATSTSHDTAQIPLPDDRNPQDPILGIGPEPERPPEISGAPPFRRWMSILRRRHLYQDASSIISSFHDDSGVYPLDRSTSVQSAESHPTYSDSASSSLGFVTRVKTASLTVSGASITTASERTSVQNKPCSRTRAGTLPEIRRSTDSTATNLGTTLDEDAWLRSLQRRQIVEEIVSSEESYVADLKTLSNDYFTLVSTIPAISSRARTCIQHNINQILQLHQDLLRELHRVVPHADFTQSVVQRETYPAARPKHIRFHSVDLIPVKLAEPNATQRLRHSLELGRPPDKRSQALILDTQTAGNIAKVFNAHMSRFFAYEEYGAHWTTMSKNLAMMCKSSQGWNEYERGVEALSKLVTSDNNRGLGSRKALAFSDLLIKPIQRVCKYPLLFNELCRHTPVYDDPEAHAELEKIVLRLQETIHEVNKAKDDPKTRKLLEIAWQLQDRLDFPIQTPSRVHFCRSLGHVLVCGVLHVAYQTPERVTGQYMICILYRSCVLLATANRNLPPYSVVASIPLANASVEEADNGRGLQCHTAPYTWKLIFEDCYRLHELILSACSAEEEEVWKSKLQERIACETHGFVEAQATEHDTSSSLTLDIKPIGPVFGHADSTVRRMSVHRSVTLREKPCTTQVIIKNTQAQKLSENPGPSAPNLVTRSLSLTSTTHIATLAPRRAERIRLEIALEDVWTKDVLPFPGMSNRRVEDQIRASANSVMRKLSVASIASNFSRRSPSVSSIKNAYSDESCRSRTHRKTKSDSRARTSTDRRVVPVRVDFHASPVASVLPDFELRNPGPAERRRWTANPPADPEFLPQRTGEVDPCNEPKHARRLSAQLTNHPRTNKDHRANTRTASVASDSTITHKPELKAPLQQNEKRKNTDPRGTLSAKGALGDLQRTKALKNKSQMFKFWI
ncbi:uncharacterized protein EI97DRAFT_436053 [Westerdykella ornata]|uniref:DH domain-containing protein n=1 Tax=Westerdykella ornata TaxID=318751 RepID=A0A6A6JBM8_WESOR|nr:uncharacterized protein EI97DRAFT_436053 [Westerdykella ornata]KAF2273398.1 hypothetical protein EI97DRAFT_436053 [Westerdykella ornata]